MLIMIIAPLVTQSYLHYRQILEKQISNYCRREEKTIKSLDTLKMLAYQLKNVLLIIRTEEITCVGNTQF